MDLDNVRNDITRTFLEGKEYIQAGKDCYTDFSYPKVIKLMRFHTERYRVAGFGHFMTMHTRTSLGMELLTASFTPGEGGSVPYCLIDIMTVGKKRTVFVEYYDCTANGANMSGLEEVGRRYGRLKEYSEKPKWYVSERTPYSLIKCGEKSGEQLLREMILESVKAYRAGISDAGTDPSNVAGLKAFRDRMINEGNPSSSVLEKVFGRDGAREFFIQCVMPIL